MASSLNQMRNQVKLWLKRRDIEDTTITECINLAVTRLERSLRIPSMEGVVSPELYLPDIGEPDIYEPRFLLPADFLEMKHLYVGNYDVQRRDLAYVIRAQKQMTAGSPCYFAREREYIDLAPIPSMQDIDITMVYYFEVPELVEETDTNWFLNAAEGAVLYGSLTECFLLLRDNEEAGMWEKKFQQEAQAIQRHADEAEFAGSTLTIKNRIQ